MEYDTILHGDSLEITKQFNNEVFHLILSDIPYGLSYDDWDVLHKNTNSALLGTSPAQKKAGDVFKSRGKPLNGWSEADKLISKEYYSWCLTWGSEWLRILKPGASVFIFAGRRMAHRCICALEDSGFIFKDMIAWKKAAAPLRAQRVSVVYERRGDDMQADIWRGWRLGNLRPIFEPILWFMKPYKLGGTLADNIRDYGVGGFNDVVWKKYTTDSSNTIQIQSKKNDRGLHPTQKPVELLTALIELVTQEGQVVFDPFCGSGSTLVAAKQNKRHFIGIERDETFFRIAQSRILVENQKASSCNPPVVSLFDDQLRA